MDQPVLDRDRARVPDGVASEDQPERDIVGVDELANGCHGLVHRGAIGEPDGDRGPVDLEDEVDLAGTSLPEPDLGVGVDTLCRVERSRMFPFRLFTAYRVYREAVRREPTLQDDHVERFLEDAIQRTVQNVPDTRGNTAVGIDLSGSMQNHRVSAGAAVTVAEIASFFGGVAMNKGAYAAAFGKDMEVIDRSHADTPALEIMSHLQGPVQDRIDTGGTNAWLFMRHLSDLDGAFDRIVFLTDMQAWDTTRFVGGRDGSGQTVKEWVEAYREDPKDCAVYLLDLSAEGDLLLPEGAPNVYNVSGWNESILEFVEYAEHPAEIIEEISAY